MIHESTLQCRHNVQWRHFRDRTILSFLSIFLTATKCVPKLIMPFGLCAFLSCRMSPYFNSLLEFCSLLESVWFIFPLIRIYCSLFVFPFIWYTHGTLTQTNNSGCFFKGDHIRVRAFVYGGTHGNLVYGTCWQCRNGCNPGPFCMVSYGKVR